MSQSPASLLLRSALLSASALALSSCATPAERWDREARDLGLRREEVQGADFRHATYFPSSTSLHPKPSKRAPVPLHVYVGGDGSPRGAVRWKPADPTPEPVMLRLMALDRAPRVYLGRPCYHAASPCDGWVLSLGRYSEAVIASMAAAVERLREPGQPLVLLGHSGGGTIAVLLAARLVGVRAVVTVASNLDVRAWAELHGFVPLTGSLDPALAPPLPPGILQLHVVAGRDDNVPPSLVRAYLARQPDARLRVFPELSHDGPWEPVWTAVLDELEALLGPGGGERNGAGQNWRQPPSVTR